MESDGKSGGKTYSQAASPVARLGVEVQVRWRNLESARKSGGGFLEPDYKSGARLVVRLVLAV